MVKNLTQAFDYTIQATFKRGTEIKVSKSSYTVRVIVIDKYKANRVNYRNFEENFAFRMRSNDSEAHFPMHRRDILGNNLNVTIKQVSATLDNPENNSTTNSPGSGS